MSFKAIIDRIENSATDGNDWCRLHCRDQNGRYAKLLAFGPVAGALVAALSSRAGEGIALTDVQSGSIVVEVDGDWQTRPSRTEGRRPDRHLRISRFELLSGPSSELFRLRYHADRLLDEATKLRKGGDLAAAFAKFEEFVANVAQKPAPSREEALVDPEPFVEPEEIRPSVVEASGDVVDALLEIDRAASVPDAPVAGAQVDASSAEPRPDPVEADVAVSSEEVDEEAASARRMGIEVPEERSYKAPAPSRQPFVPARMTPDPVTPDEPESAPAPAAVREVEPDPAPAAPAFTLSFGR